MSWFDEGFIAIDTETTGLSPATSRILEIAVVTFWKGEVVNEWSSLIDPPGLNWEDPGIQRALQVNNIVRKDCLGKPSFEQVLPDLMVELSSKVWVGHNIEFDLAQLTGELKRINHEPLVPVMAVCTKNLASQFNNSADKNHLSNVATRYKVKQADAHRAVVDASTSGLILVEMQRQGQLPTKEADMQTLCRKAAASWRGLHQWKKSS